MKKTVATILVIVMALGLMVCLAGCNKQLIDVNYTYHYAILNRGDGEQIIEISSWKNFDGLFKLTSVDGISYLVHPARVILLTELEKDS